MVKRKRWVSVLAGILALIMVFSVIIGVIPTKVDASSASQLRVEINQLRNEKKELDEKLEKLKEQLSENLDGLEEIVAQKDIIDQEVFMLYSQMDNLNEQISAYSLLIAEKQDDLDVAQTRLNELKQKHKERIRAIEEDGGLSYWAVLFQAKSFTDLLGRFYMIQEIAAADQRRIKEISAVANEVTAARDELQEEKKELEQSRKDLEIAQEQLEIKQEEAQKLLADMIATGAEFQEMMEKAELEAIKIREDLAQKEEQYEQWTGKEVPDETWMVPCKYIKLTSKFGYRDNPTNPGKTEYHDGVDLANVQGTPIYATRSGYVSKATWGTNLGNYVKIDHGDGNISTYAHMVRYIVSAGQWVEQGEQIGYMGTTGRSTGPHLHFSIYLNGVAQNPAELMSLPVWP